MSLLFFSQNQPAKESPRLLKGSGFSRISIKRVSGVLQSSLKLPGNPAQEPNAVFYTGMSTMSFVCSTFFNIPVIYFFLSSWAGDILQILQSDWFRERAVFSPSGRSYMLITSGSLRVEVVDSGIILLTLPLTLEEPFNLNPSFRAWNCA